MAKSTNILEFISILQFSQMYLIFEINVQKKSKDDCKRLQKTSMCINLVCILWAWAFLKLLAITLWSQSCCLCSSALMRSPSALGDRPGSRPPKYVHEKNLRQRGTTYRSFGRYQRSRWWGRTLPWRGAAVAETKKGFAPSARASWIRASRSSGIIIPLKIQNQIFIPLSVITTHVRSRREGNVFSLSVHQGGGVGGRGRAGRGTPVRPAARGRRWGRGRGIPVRPEARGKGGEGGEHGEGERCTPRSYTWIPLPSSGYRTDYAVGGMPHVATQKDILVLRVISSFYLQCGLLKMLLEDSNGNRFELCDIILVVCQIVPIHLSLLISHWIHEKILVLCLCWIDKRNDMNKLFCYVPIIRFDQNNIVQSDT